MYSNQKKNFFNKLNVSSKNSRGTQLLLSLLFVDDDDDDQIVIIKYNIEEK